MHDTQNIMNTQNIAEQIFVLMPYHHNGTWVFDDPARSLIKEPFVSGIPDIINYLVRHIDNARSGFKLLFSESVFPICQAELRYKSTENGGCWYYCPQTKTMGWLCPQLFKYFNTAPQRLYAAALPCVKEALRSNQYLGPIGP